MSLLSVLESKSVQEFGRYPTEGSYTQQFLT